MPAGWLHFRADDELISAIDDLVKETPGANRSRICRMLLWQALEKDADRAAVREAAWEFRRLQQRIVRRAVVEMVDNLPAIIDEELKAHDAEEEEAA